MFGINNVSGTLVTLMRNPFMRIPFMIIYYC